MTLRAIVLAAGKGTRMKSERAKVLHEIAGRPLVRWVLDAVGTLRPESVVAVVGHEADEVKAVLPDGVAAAYQAEQLGTADAAGVGLDALGAAPDDTVLVVPGDMPLLRGETFAELLRLHLGSGRAATILSAELEDPTGYGRIVRDANGEVVAVVEERDATAEQRGIREVNTSVYAFRAGDLAEALAQVGTDNAQGEQYLTDVVEILHRAGRPLAAVAVDAVEALGVNSHDQLAAAAAVIRERINRRWMQRGVWMADPDRVHIDAGVELGVGARIWPDTYLLGTTRVGDGAEVGPDVFASDSVIGPRARVWYAVLRDVEVGSEANVGPFASLRAGTVLEEGAKAGTFVEIKKSVVGAGAKVPHLSYMGDATIGAGTNIGAGSITCNWDGFDKHPTMIGERVFIGSDTMLVAPVTVGDDAVTGAGSTITKDVPPGALAVERSEQRIIPGYAERRRRRRSEQEPS